MTTSPVEVFWRPGCPFCLVLRTGLVLRGVRPTWRNIWEDLEAAAFVRAHNQGNETVPTVRIGSTVLTNPSARTVRSHLRRAAHR
jgi:glutaredoxin